MIKETLYKCIILRNCIFKVLRWGCKDSHLERQVLGVPYFPSPKSGFGVRSRQSEALWLLGIACVNKELDDTHTH